MASSSIGPSFRAGGRKQRQACRDHGQQLVAVAVAQQLVQPELAKHILQKWAWGQYTGAEVQRIAMFAVDDILAFVKASGAHVSNVKSDIQALAGLGTRGRHPGNINRELIAWLSSYPKANAFKTKIEAKILKPKKGRGSIARILMTFLLPHELFHQ